MGSYAASVPSQNTQHNNMQNTTIDKRSDKRQNSQVARVSFWPSVVVAVLTTVHAQGQTAPAAIEEKSPWEGSAALGFTMTSGNSDTLLLNANIERVRKKEKNEWRLRLDGTYGENDGTKNNEQLKGSSQYNRIFGDEGRWYFYGRVEGLYDGIADIDGRFTIGPGIGYYFIKNDKMSLSGEVGPGVVIEKLGSEDWNTYFTMRAAERFEYKINARSRLWQSVEFLPEVPDTENYIVNAEIGVESSITEQWGLRVVLQDSYDNQPSPGREQNDLKLVAGIAYKF
jgi:putative salt-induced outer membrane protein